MRRHSALHIALLLLLPLTWSCSSRADYTPEKALIGHWSSESGSVHYYFSKDKYTMVDNGEIKTLPYFVLEIDDDKRALKIEIKAPEVSFISHIKTLTFNEDKRSLLEHSVFMGITVPPTRWVYIDDKEQP